jgi:hypothetical protein
MSKEVVAKKKTLRTVEWSPAGAPPKRIITKMQWIELIPYIRKKLNEDGCTYAFLGKELGEKYGGKGVELSRARIEQQVRWLNENHDAGIKLRKGKGIPKIELQVRKDITK